jgi:Ger(x)C family germination protein
MVTAALLLSGCSSNLYSNHRDMERLRPIQTFGLDRTEEGVTVSVSSGAGPEDTPPLVMKALASSIETAIDRLQDYSPKDELFYAHVEYLLLGQSMAEQGVDNLLNWVERSPSMRLDTATFLVKGAACDAVTASAGETSDITERLASLEREQLSRGQHIYTLREIATALADRGCALCLAALPAQGTVYTQEDGETVSLVPAGYGVLQNGQLAAYLTQNESLGVQLLEEGATGAQLTVDETVLECFQGDAQVTGQWDEEGNLLSILVTGSVQAGVLEQSQENSPDTDALEEQFTAQLRQCLEEVITHSQEMNCDFLNLEQALLQDAPKNSAALKAHWDEVFPTVPVEILVTGQVERSYDLSQ